MNTLHTTLQAETVRRQGSKGLLAGLALTLTLAAGATFADLSEGVGGLPGMGGNDQEITPRDPRPTLCLTGTFEAVTGALVSVEGDGEVTTQVTDDGRIMLVFHGDLEVTFHEGALANAGVDLELQTSFRGGTTQAAFTFEGGRTPVFSISEGNTLGLDVDRMRSIGLLDAPSTLWTLDDENGRTRVDIVSEGEHLSLHLQQ